MDLVIWPNFCATHRATTYPRKKFILITGFVFSAVISPSLLYSGLSSFISSIIQCVHIGIGFPLYSS